MYNEMSFQNEIELLAKSHNLTLSVWRNNKSGRTIVTVALHTGERAHQFRYQEGVVWSGQETVKLWGRQFVGSDVSKWCDGLLNDAKKYLASITVIPVTETVYEITDDSFGGSENFVTLSEIEFLYESFESDDWTFEVVESMGNVRLYATRKIDSEYSASPSPYSYWIKINRDEMYLDIARVAEVAHA